ncbi:helix-turn-helix transcriptional regulator [Pelagibacterium sp.]|uniref:AraC family transcriptional regulator n=1 Tax=Pelagibacterium sp. TaxID=1967288 RepID=UPI003BAA955A
MVASQRDTSRSAFRAVSTRAVRKRDRFDYWQSQFSRVALRPGDLGQARNFDGHMRYFNSEEGATFSLARNGDTIADFAKPDGEFLLISQAIAGGAKIVGADGEEMEISPLSGITVVDGTRPVTTRSQRHVQLCLVIPRAFALNALDADIDFPDRGVFTLKSSGMARMLAAQMANFAREADFLKADEARLVMRGLVDIALGAVAGAGDARANEPEAGGALFGAAVRLIAANFSDPNMTAATIAQAMGCSRARLFREFERCGETVGQTIRKYRMEHASNIIVAPRPETIDQIAYKCGYRSASAFTRAFKGHFGIAPLHYRNRSAP